MKNLLIIHLESLNRNNFLLNRNMFPFISEIEAHSVSFQRYFSTATSTLMTIGDLLYGGMDQYETAETLDDVPENYVYKSSLMDDLKSLGYHTGIYVYPDGNNRESAEEKHLAGFQNQMLLKRDYQEYLDAFSEGMKKPPFALMSCDYISNSSFNKYALEGDEYDGFKKWDAGYRAMDEHVQDLFELLEKNGVSDSTVVLFYGDHGDDYWTHAFRCGMTHAIEPNALLTHTPFFVHDPQMCGKGITDYDTLLSAVDVRKLVMDTLDPQKNWLHELKRTGRKYVFSRSAYAAQPIGNTRYFKGYAVCDGTYLLLVSPEGMAMYHILMDSDCHNNLLSHFYIEDGRLVDDLSDPEYYPEAIWGFWREPTRRKVRQTFYFLKEILYKETLRTYMVGGRSEESMNEEMDFAHITGRQDIGEPVGSRRTDV